MKFSLYKIEGHGHRHKGDTANDIKGHIEIFGVFRIDKKGGRTAENKAELKEHKPYSRKKIQPLGGLIIAASRIEAVYSLIVVFLLYAGGN